MGTTNGTRIPKYRLHKASGQAEIRLNGRDIYLGVSNSEDSTSVPRVVRDGLGWVS